MREVFSTYSGRAEIRCDPVAFNLADFSGLILRCTGDGKRYTAVLRTAGDVKVGGEGTTGFDTHQNKGSAVGIPFSACRARLRSTAPDRGAARPDCLQRRGEPSRR